MAHLFFIFPETKEKFVSKNSLSFRLSKLVKDPGVEAANVFHTSAQCTQSVNKARRLIVMIKRLF